MELTTTINDIAIFCKYILSIFAKTTPTIKIDKICLLKIRKDDIKKNCKETNYNVVV